MKFIGLFVLVHFILTLGAGTALNLPPWVVCKVLVAGLKLGVTAIWLLAIWRFLTFIRN